MKNPEYLMLYMASNQPKLWRNRTKNVDKAIKYIVYIGALSVPVLIVRAIVYSLLRGGY